MHSIISVGVTLVMVWLAVIVAAKGMQTTVEASTSVQVNHLNEYSEHYCGSIRAAIANLNAANDLLQSTDAARSKDYTRATDAYLSPLEDALAAVGISSVRFNCAEAVTVLHAQSIDETPFDLPNFVYRLSGKGGGQ